MPPYSSSNDAAISPASVNTFRARATSGIISTLPSTNLGSFSSALWLCGAKWSVAICSASSRTASNVSRECSANRGRLVSDSTSSHSWSRKSRSRRERINDDALTRASLLPGAAQPSVEICGQGPDLGIRGAGRRRGRYSSYMCSDGSGDVLAELDAVLDRLAGEDLKGMFGPAVLDRTGRLLRLRNRLEAQLARASGRGELTQAAEADGQASMQSWLRGHARLSGAAAHRQVAVGRAGAGSAAGGGRRV